jgi:hypothetical protein
MKPGDNTTIYLQERQHMEVPAPLVQEESGQPWLPKDGVHLLLLPLSLLACWLL